MRETSSLEPRRCNLVAGISHHRNLLTGISSPESSQSTRRVGESQTAKNQQEQSALDALASAAVLGDSLGEPEVATTTRHPRHRAGCSCIVCIQPPSGKGGHKSNCTCTVCSTVKRSFKMLMMRRKKKQLEREESTAADQKNKEAKQSESKTEKEGNTRKKNLNSNPYNREDVEGVAREKDESKRREVGECFGSGGGHGELEGEGEKNSEETRGSS